MGILFRPMWPCSLHGRAQEASSLHFMTATWQVPMSFISKIFGKSASPPGGSPAGDRPGEPLVPVPIPALGVLLLNLEKEKGSPLSEQEVLAARDKAACIMLPLSKKRAMDERRGYEGINPENVWPEWQAFRAAVQRDAP